MTYQSGGEGIFFGRTAFCVSLTFFFGSFVSKNAFFVFKNSSPKVSKICSRFFVPTFLGMSSASVQVFPEVSEYVGMKFLEYPTNNFHRESKCDCKSFGNGGAHDCLF